MAFSNTSNFATEFEESVLDCVYFLHLPFITAISSPAIFLFASKNSTIVARDRYWGWFQSKLFILVLVSFHLIDYFLLFCFLQAQDR